LGPLNDHQLKAVRAIDDCASRLRGLIDNLLNVTAIETDRMRFVFKEYDLHSLAQGHLARWRREFEAKGIVLLVDVAPPPLKGVGDPDRLGRALEQLLDNAAKFTPENGTVFVKIGPRSDSEYEFRV